MKTRLHTYTGALPQPIVSRILILFFTLVVILMSFSAYAGPRYTFTAHTAIPDTGIVTGSNNNHSSFSLPLVLTSFSASLINENVVLSWTTGQEKNLNHFVIERSSNGRDYTEMALVFTAGYDNVKQNYSYKDVINAQASGILYYRIRMVDAEGRRQNSPVRIIKSGSALAKGLQLSVYPNPVTEELRITVPAEWQNKQVSYDVYNSKGQLVKHKSNSQSGQTEIVNVQELGSGLYIVKAYTEDAAAMQRIVKQ